VVASGFVVALDHDFEFGGIRRSHIPLDDFHLENPNDHRRVSALGFLSALSNEVSDVFSHLLGGERSLQSLLAHRRIDAPLINFSAAYATHDREATEARDKQHGHPTHIRPWATDLSRSEHAQSDDPVFADPKRMDTRAQ